MGGGGRREVGLFLLALFEEGWGGGEGRVVTGLGGWRDGEEVAGMWYLEFSIAWFVSGDLRRIITSCA